MHVADTSSGGKNMSTVLAADETHESKALYNQAMEKVARSHIRDAMGDLEKALEISPNNAAYLSQYGLCVAMEREDFGAALKLCERARRMDPRNTVNKVNLGKVYRLSGRAGAAYRVLLEAWKSDRTHPAAATALQRMGIRRPPIVRFLDRGHWINVRLGRLRSRITRRHGM